MKCRLGVLGSSDLIKQRSPRTRSLKHLTFISLIWHKRITIKKIRWVHTSLVSRPQVYFNLTSDMNGSNFNLSSLLLSRANVSFSKQPKYTSKLSPTHPYRRTYALSKQFQEIGCQSNALFGEISEHTTRLGDYLLS